jgi:hypothetical protein
MFTTNLQQRYAASSDTDVESQSHASLSCVEVVKTLVDLETASRGSQACQLLWRLPCALWASTRALMEVVVIGGLKEDGQSVSTEFDDVASICLDDVNQGSEELVQRLR